jgi:hypothetical protein
MVNRDPLARPVGLKARGAALWAKESESRPLDGFTAVLLAEMCRTADALDRLDQILAGRAREWIKLGDEIEMLADGGVKVTVVVDGILSERRQQQLAFRQLAALLKVGELPERVVVGKLSLVEQLRGEEGAS